MKNPSRVFFYCLLWAGALDLVQAMPPDLGPNVTVFDPSMPTSAIQSAVDAIAQVQALPSSQFDTTPRQTTCGVLPKPQRLTQNANPKGVRLLKRCSLLFQPINPTVKGDSSHG